jgi:hypothetical protein
MFSDSYQPQTAIQSAQKALDPNLSDHDLAQLAYSEEAKVRAAVAERTNTPLTTLVRLATDVAPAVRAGVARNQRVDIPIELREDLAKDKSAEVVFALVANPAVPSALIGKLARSRNREVAAAAKKRLKESGGAGAKVLGSLGIATN